MTEQEEDTLAQLLGFEACRDCDITTGRHWYAPDGYTIVVGFDALLEWSANAHSNV